MPSPFQSLRRASFLARLVLAWFVMAIGVAAASPLVHPVSMELVCSASGAIKLVATNTNTNTDPGTQTVSPHTLDCALCFVAGAPPPADPSPVFASMRLAQSRETDTASPIAGLSFAPFSARGPPPFLVL